MNIEPDYTLKICILGDVATGKSSLLQRLCQNHFSSIYSSTIGVDFSIYTIYLDEYSKKIKLQIWDTAGQESFLSIVRSYFRKMAGCIIVYDITNNNSFKNIKKWIGELQNYCIKMPTIYIVGNKSDLNIRREVDKSELNKLIHDTITEYDYDIYGDEISVKDNIKIHDVFFNLTEIIYKEKIHLKNSLDYEDYDIKNNYKKSFSLIEPKKYKKKCC